HPRIALFNVNVHLAPHSEFGKVDSRLHRETRSGNDPAIVARLEVVHVGAVAVDVFADRVPGAVNEIVAVAVTGDDGARGVVHLVTVERRARSHRVLHQTDGRVARLPDHVENLGVPARDFPAHEAGPGDVEVDRAGNSLLG